jgi:cell cycle checkpoint control protein RAD9A
VDVEEFGDIAIDEKRHIIISVKDFRAVLQHAQITSGELSACYSKPGRPMKLFYSGDGLLCEFVLMTVGEKDAAAQNNKKGKVSAAKEPRPALEAASHRASSVATSAAEPPKRPPQTPTQQVPPPRLRQSLFEMRPPPLPPPSTLRSESLFVLQADDDQQWEPVNQDEEDDEGDNARLEWDVSGQSVLLRDAFLGPINPDTSLQNPSTMRIGPGFDAPEEPPAEQPDRLPSGLEPTQRLSEVRGPAPDLYISAESTTGPPFRPLFSELMRLQPGTGILAPGYRRANARRSTCLSPGILDVLQALFYKDAGGREC